MSGFVCVESIVMSSAYVMSVMLLFCGVGTSTVYMLKSVGDRTPPCGTPVFMFLRLEVVSLYLVYCILPLCSYL